ncbi:MAG: hypothetical protein DHS20C15_10670 [Planctomycetota bacterium]|nr:MAG: hypothetical protein DHS20C15_10670 [Planctomycetota bacterium]
MGFLSPDEGDVRVDGRSASNDPERVRQAIDPAVCVLAARDPSDGRADNSAEELLSGGWHSKSGSATRDLPQLDLQVTAHQTGT